MNGYRFSQNLIADAPSLDFLNVIGADSASGMKPLSSGQDLLEWIEETKLAPSDALRTVRANSIPGELDAVASQARMLGDWFRGFVVEFKPKFALARQITH
jgi:hypothetical protein